MTELLKLTDVNTYFETRNGPLHAIDDVSLTVRKGEVLGLVGESGSGKSVLAFSILGLLDRAGRVTGGRIEYRGQDLTTMDEAGLRRIRGNKIAMIFQDPTMTLNPLLRIGTQMIEAIRAHRNVDRAIAQAEARDALGKVGIPSPEERLNAYPHEFSGGMQQRVAIAIALLNNPDLIIADEPTTALDVTIQAQLLAEMTELRRTRGMALIWITHDLSLLDGFADNLAVMYAGRVVEYGPFGEVITRPRHRYTRGLIDSIPAENTGGKRLFQIPGTAPGLANLPTGCAFRPRCGVATALCTQRPVNRTTADGRWFKCFHPCGAEI